MGLTSASSYSRFSGSICVGFSKASVSGKFIPNSSISEDSGSESVTSFDVITVAATPVAIAVAAVALVSSNFLLG